MPQPTALPVWKKLEKYHRSVRERSIGGLFQNDPDRFSKMNLTLPGLLVDFSKTNLDSEGLRLLVELARAQNVEGWRDRMFAGAAINTTENQPVLHTALRRPKNDLVTLAGRSIMPDIHAVLNQMRIFSEQIRSGAWLGYRGATPTDIVVIGIGGQEVGLHTAVRALGAFRHPGLRTHFVANVDGHVIAPLLATLDPHRTLFMVSSKTFSTPETLTNANRAKAWLVSAGIPPSDLYRHMVALSANPRSAEILGVPAANLFPFWNYVGGRFSVWSSTGLPLALSIGFERFREFLAGAHMMDRHFASAPLEHNIPVLMALIGIWHINMCDDRSQAIVPYDERLSLFPSYVQQIDMESNGKSVDREGGAIGYATAPAILGGVGTTVQHSFFQALHQGPHPIPVDILTVRTHDHPLADHHRRLCANAIAQAQALMMGEETDDPATTCPGNRPSLFVVLDKMDPYHLGMLMAMYEHKVFVQGVIWHVNSFDQPGVALGKKLADQLIESDGKKGVDSSTATLWHLFR